MATAHKSVLYQEILAMLQPASGKRYVDGTLGAGGHAAGILDASQPDGQLLGFELDSQALTIARDRLQAYGVRAILIHASYATIKAQLEALGWPAVSGIVVDLGVSSMQLDTPERGFSFQTEAPLDMRFDANNPVSAADLVNDLPERELADVIYLYGEEVSSRQIAHAIVKARPISSTKRLAEVVAGAARQSPRYRPVRSAKSGASIKKMHPATLTFQALRIAVNRELDALESFLPQANAALLPGGRLAVISFHSLEDRIVKTYFRSESKDCLCPPRQPLCTCGHKATLKEITRRPVNPQAAEVEDNPRSRSARLRVAERLPDLV